MDQHEQPGALSGDTVVVSDDGVLMLDKPCLHGEQYRAQGICTWCAVDGFIKLRRQEQQQLAQERERVRDLTRLVRGIRYDYRELDWRMFVPNEILDEYARLFGKDDKGEEFPFNTTPAPPQGMGEAQEGDAL